MSYPVPRSATGSTGAGDLILANDNQGLDNELIEGAPAVEEQAGRIRRHPRLGGLLN